MDNSRTAAVSLVLALSLAVGGCGLQGCEPAPDPHHPDQSYRCGPAPGPDRPDAEEPDRLGGLTFTDSTFHLPRE